MRGSPLGAMTAAQSDRADRLKAMGCLCCWLEGCGYVPAELHHITVGDRHGQLRLGHDETVPLCIWHHRGRKFDGRTEEYCRRAFGPSLALQPERFRKRYGSAESLVLKANRRLKNAVWA